MSYFNEQVRACLATEGIQLSAQETISYSLICDRAKKIPFEYKTKKDLKKGIRFSLWHIYESDTNSTMTHWLVLPGHKSWKSKGKEVATKLVVNIVTGQKMFLKIRRPTNVLAIDHLISSRQEAANNRLLNSPVQHMTRCSLGVGTKAYLFQSYRGNHSLQTIIDDPSSAPQKIVNLLLASGQALSAMHARGYLHVDFKPRNIVFNSATYNLSLVDLEFMISMDAGAAGVRHIAGTPGFQHDDWLKQSIRDFHSGLGVKYTPKNDLYAFLVTADLCLGTAYSHADEGFRQILTPAWVRIRQWKDLPYDQLPTLSEVLSSLNQSFSHKPANIISTEPVGKYYTRPSFRMK